MNTAGQDVYASTRIIIHVMYEYFSVQHQENGMSWMEHNIEYAMSRWADSMSSWELTCTKS